MTGEPLRICGYLGETEVRPGDRFRFPYDGGDAEWEIVRQTGSGIYSPSGLGGCAVLACKLVTGSMPQHYERYVEDGLVEFCADSIANAIIRAKAST